MVVPEVPATVTRRQFWATIIGAIGVGVFRVFNVAPKTMVVWGHASRSPTMRVDGYWGGHRVNDEDRYEVVSFTWKSEPTHG